MLNNHIVDFSDVWISHRVPWNGSRTATESPERSCEARESTGVWTRRSTGSKILLSKERYHEVEHLGSGSMIYRYCIHELPRVARISSTTHGITSSDTAMQAPPQGNTRTIRRFVKQLEPSIYRSTSAAETSRRPTATHAPQFLVSYYRPLPSH